MSAIGCILNFNGRRVDAASLRSLFGSLERRGPDGGEMMFATESIGVCYRAFHTTPESRMESQPHRSRDGNLMVGDLRLDNREELIPQLADIVGKKSFEITDIDLAMAAYQKWGDQFPHHLIGEFALVLVSPSSRRLVLARDHIGARPLYYFRDRLSLICSSTIESLLNFDFIPKRINERYIAGFLAYTPEPGLTAFEQLYSVKPAHLVTVTSDGRLTEEPFWAVEPESQIRYRNDSQYEEAFIDLFSDAVKGPLRSDRVVMADLSGGLDSSSVVCMADNLVSTGRVATGNVETISHVYDESSTCDERKFISHVEKQRGLIGHHLRDDDYPILAPSAPKPSISAPSAFYPFAEFHRAKRATMEARGARVILSGKGGDQILNSNPDPYPELGELMQSLRLIELHRRLQSWSISSKRPYLDLFWQNLLVPSLPGSFQSFLSRTPGLKVPPWINKEFAKRINLRELRLGPNNDGQFRRVSGRDQLHGFLSVMYSVSISHDYGLENINSSYPFLHRPLVEFMQAIPFDQKVRPNETRSLLRRAMRNLLPHPIVTRKGKKSPTEALIRALNRESQRLGALLKDPLVCSYGFATLEPLRAAFERARYGYDLSSLEVVKIFCLELWLQVFEGANQKRKAA